MPEEFPRLPPREAIDYLRAKGFKESFAWQDIWQEEHARAFTVAKAMSRDVLQTIRAGVDKALAEGLTLEQFRRELTPILQAKGWWGRKPMRDPLTGQIKTVQLGSPRRLKIIYETNMRMAQAAGRWDQIQRTKRFMPYLRYTAVMDDRTRPQHAEWHGTILPVDDGWWDTHYPPCGWNCRCTVIQLDAATIAERGWQVSDAPPPSGTPIDYINPRTGETLKVPDGIDPGFAYNVGRAWLGGLEPPPLLTSALPELEPGIGPKVPRGAPAPQSMLPADVSEAEAVDAFVKGAGVEPAGIASTGSGASGVVTDASGWPLPIGRNWFVSPGGASAVPAGDRRRLLGLVGRALASPTQIRLRWVTGADGTPMLFRRYIARVDGLAIVVDVGRAGWRFATARDAGFDLAQLSTGTTIFQAK